jgi:hypothetical protein
MGQSVANGHELEPPAESWVGSGSYHRRSQQQLLFWLSEQNSFGLARLESLDVRFQIPTTANMKFIVFLLNSILYTNKFWFYFHIQQRVQCVKSSTQSEIVWQIIHNKWYSVTVSQHWINCYSAVGVATVSQHWINCYSAVGVALVLASAVVLTVLAVNISGDSLNASEELPQWELVMCSGKAAGAQSHQNIHDPDNYMTDYKTVLKWKQGDLKKTEVSFFN